MSRPLKKRKKHFRQHDADNEHGRWMHGQTNVLEFKRNPPEYIDGELEWERALAGKSDRLDSQRALINRMRSAVKP